jgi:hypothetical protein
MGVLRCGFPFGGMSSGKEENLDHKRKSRKRIGENVNFSTAGDLLQTSFNPRWTKPTGRNIAGFRNT